MKAILVMNMPECYYMVQSGLGKCTSSMFECFLEPLKRLEKPEINKVDWCPLKEMPNKMSDENRWFSKDYAEGWNACIDEILKDFEEKEGDSAMTHTVTIPTQVQLEEYFVLRAIKDTGGKKTVISEKKFDTKPMLGDIAQFLVKSGADFVSTSHNYRVGDGEIPFV